MSDDDFSPEYLARMYRREVKAVARAICKSRSCEGVDCCQWPAQTARKITCAVDRGGYDDAAKDAIAAMKALM